MRRAAASVAWACALLVGVCVTGAAWGGAAWGGAAAQTVTLSIHVAEKQASGLPWRGSKIPNIMAGPLLFNQLHNSAPSVILCVVRGNGGAPCSRDAQGQVGSPCPLAYDCSFDDIALPPDDVFGLVFVSQGMKLRALVDVLTITRSPHKRSDPPILAMDERLRFLAGQLAPPDKTEAQRRTRKSPVMELQTLKKDGAVLVQSQLKLE